MIELEGGLYLRRCSTNSDGDVACDVEPTKTFGGLLDTWGVSVL